MLIERGQELRVRFYGCDSEVHFNLFFIKVKRLSIICKNAEL